MFTATHAGRYQRQALMKEIESKQNDADLICYVSGDRREIERDDTIGFVDLLHNVPIANNIDLLLHTVGGDVDAAHKLIELVHARLGKKGRLRVIVPASSRTLAH